MLAGNRRKRRLLAETNASAYLPRAISDEIFKDRHALVPSDPGDLLLRELRALVVLAGAEQGLGVIQVGGGRRDGEPARRGCHRGEEADG